MYVEAYQRRLPILRVFSHYVKYLVCHETRCIGLTSEMFDICVADDGSEVYTRCLWVSEGFYGNLRHCAVVVGLKQSELDSKVDVRKLRARSSSYKVHDVKATANQPLLNKEA